MTHLSPPKRTSITRRLFEGRSLSPHVFRRRGPGPRTGGDASALVGTRAPQRSPEP